VVILGIMEVWISFKMEQVGEEVRQQLIEDEQLTTNCVITNESVGFINETLCPTHISSAYTSK